MAFQLHDVSVFLKEVRKHFQTIENFMKKQKLSKGQIQKSSITEQFLINLQHIIMIDFDKTKYLRTRNGIQY